MTPWELWLTAKRTRPWAPPTSLPEPHRSAALACWSEACAAWYVRRAGLGLRRRALARELWRRYRYKVIDSECAAQGWVP
jgi:hypothetical protein